MEQQTSLNIGTIGQKLESARNAKGVSISEAGRETKILSKFIQAMEADDFGVISAPIYAKSFIRMYAKYLGLDDQVLVEEYVNKHIPKSRSKLAEEVRNGLSPEPVSSVKFSPSVLSGGKIKEWFDRIFSNFSMKQGLIVGGVSLAVLIVLLSVTQCDSDEDTATSPASLSGVQEKRQALFENQPDGYLVKPGVVEVNPK
jgi:hypothetical protein